MVATDVSLVCLIVFKLTLIKNMHCRSILLIEKELKELLKEPLWGISIHQVPHHPLVCFANISGKQIYINM